MMKYASSAWPVLLVSFTLAAFAGCGDGSEHRAAARDDTAGATGVLVVRKPQIAAWSVVEDEAFCSGTLVAPDVVLTSARCANVAHTAQVAFAGHFRHGRPPVLVRAVSLAPDAPGVPCADDDDPYADAEGLDVADPVDALDDTDGHDGAASQDTSAMDASDADVSAMTRRAACRALRARCGVQNITAPDAHTLACVHAQPPMLLQQAGFAGFGPGHDLGLLFLEQSLDATPAPLAGAAMQRVLMQPRASLRAVSAVRDQDAVPDDGSKTVALRDARTRDFYRAVLAVSPTQARLAAVSGLDAIDRGGALWMRQDDKSGTTAWSLAAVSSRPWLWGGDTAFGMVYSRIDPPAAAWIAHSLSQACRDGRRVDGPDGCDGAGIATASFLQPKGCSQGMPGWFVPTMFVAWALHRAGRARRGARARLMYAWLLPLLLLPFATACGSNAESEAQAEMTSVENVSRQAIVQGAPARDRYLAVGAVVKPGTHGADPYTLHCTGTLIADDVVLTAAHCVTRAEHFQHIGRVVSKYGFRPGSDTAFGGLAGTYQVRHTVVHPAYLRASFANGGWHSTFCPDGDTRPDRQSACVALAIQCGARDLAELRAVGATVSHIDAEQAEARRLLHACVNHEGEALLRATGYLGVQDDHDFALLLLDKPVPNARLARLPRAEDVDALVHGAMMLGVGYGEQTQDAALQPRGSKRGEKRFMRNTLEELGHWEMRVGLGPPQACHADSGGPLFFAHPDADATLLGVVSRLADGRSAMCDRGVIYGRVDQEADWIAATLEDWCERGLRQACAGHAAAAPVHEAYAPAPTRAASEPEHENHGCATAPPALTWLLPGALWGLIRRRRSVLK